MATALIPAEIRTRVDSWKEKAAKWRTISAADPLAATLAFCAQELEDAIAMDEAAARSEIPRTEARAERAIHVYVIRRPSSAEVKIGISTDPRRRLNQLQSGHSEQLELVAHFAGGAVEEADLHERFKAYRKRGEWFHESAEIAAWIEEVR